MVRRQELVPDYSTARTARVEEMGRDPSREAVMPRNSVHVVTAVMAWLVCTPALLAQPRVDALGDPLPEGAIARLGTTRMRQFSTPDHYCWGLGCLAWSSDGKMIATTSYSAEI